MLVKDLMTADVISAKPGTSVVEVAELLHKHSLSGMPVVSEDGVVLGMITERDFLASKSQIYLPTYIKLLSGMDYVQGGGKHLPYVTEQIVRTTAEDIMNRHIIFARPQMTIEEMAEIFSSRGNNPVAVTDEHSKLQGIISRSDMLKPMVPQGLSSSFETKATGGRLIDQQVDYVSRDFTSRFAYVTKARANIWLTTAVVLAIAGFIAGVIYVADPNLLGRSVEQGSSIQY